MVCSAVTITPGRQKTPLEENRGRASTATTDRLTRSTTSANSRENAASPFAMKASCNFRMARRPAAAHRQFG
jgi:hypothetical protein